jgi:hypothetical protein
MESLAWELYHQKAGLPSWSWTGWKGRVEYNYWLDKLEAYKEDMESKWSEHAATSELAVHMRDRLRKIQDDEAFISTKNVYEGTGGQALKVSSALVSFRGKMVRKQGSA